MQHGPNVSPSVASHVAQVSSSQLRTKFAGGSESGAGMASCPNDLATIKKQLVTWQAKTEELNQQIEVRAQSRL